VKTFKEFFMESVDDQLITMHKTMQKRREMRGKALQVVDAPPVMTPGYLKDYNPSLIAKGLRRYYKKMIVDYYSRIFKTFKDKIEPISQQGQWQMDPVKMAERSTRFHFGRGGYNLSGFNFDERYGFTDEDRQMNNILVNKMYETVHDTLPKLLGNKAKKIELKIDSDPWYTGLTTIAILIYWNQEKNLQEKSVHDAVRPGILKRQTKGKMTCAKARALKSKQKNKGNNTAKAAQRYLNYHC